MPTSTIQRLNAQALGVDEHGQHAPFVLPDEVVEISDGLARVIQPSVDRVKAPCSHFKSCGGCSLQHASDAFVMEWKVQAVEQALVGQDLSMPKADALVSPIASRRRAKLTAKRTKNGAMVGFMSARSHTLLPVPNCTVLSPEIVAAFPMLEQLTVIAASRKAHIGLSVTTTSVGLDVIVSDGKPLTDQLRLEVTQFAQQMNLARISWDDDVIVTMIPPVQSFGTLNVVPPVGAFLQATVHGEETLAATVLKYLGDAKQVVDLFAGCGTFAARILPNAIVHAIEGDAEMLAALDQGWRTAQGVKKLTTETRDLFRRPLDGDELKRFDAIIIDPPRAGAAAQVKEIATAGCDLVVMVSCSPVTFARDVRVLADAGFVLTDITIIDQFRWSNHIEIVGRCRRQ